MERSSPERGGTLGAVGADAGGAPTAPNVPPFPGFGRDRHLHPAAPLSHPTSPRTVPVWRAVLPPWASGAPHLVRHGGVAMPVLALFLALLSLTRAVEGQSLRQCFTPEHRGTPTCTAQIVAAIAHAHQVILVQAYGFTSAPIAKALVEAHKRGVDVRVILDKSNLKEGYSSAAFLQHAGIPALIDSNHAIAHNKVMILDVHEVITGSFNFTKAAEEKNAENVVFIDDPATATAFTQNWKAHADHSAPSPLERHAAAAQGDSARSSGVVTGGAVTGNRRSHVYRPPGCPGLATIAVRNRIEFPTALAAQAAGYRPARNCP